MTQKIQLKYAETAVSLRLFFIISFFTILSSISVSASATDLLLGRWSEMPEHWRFVDEASIVNSKIADVDAPHLTGGNFAFVAKVKVRTSDVLVLDFKNASVIGRFEHYILDSSGQLVETLHGGIQDKTADNPFFLRHGRELRLTPGQYTIVTSIQSPYFIAQPQPYLDTLPHYRQAIKWGNLLALVCLGVLSSLGVYYGMLAYVRRKLTEFTYAIFIWMNVVFNGMTMLLFPDLFSIHWIYLAGAPILISNFAYAEFVTQLLEIKPASHPKLYFMGRTIQVLLVILFCLALVFHHWMLEFARYGVGLILIYGLLAGIARARENFVTAKMYLFAIALFFIIGFFTISSTSLDGIYTIYVEHIGLLAVTVESLMIGLVLAYQFADLHRQKSKSIELIQQSLKIAHSDALTGLPNRYVLDENLIKLPRHGFLTFIDMNNLKLYNDKFGHAKGDEMLISFANCLQQKLQQEGTLHRIGGDEFAITTSMLDQIQISKHIMSAVERLQLNGFESAGASFGSVKRDEALDLDMLKEMADKRMYQNKSNKKTLTSGV